ncbi:MAG: protein kinase domain-containing protein [Planctomycetota bacterium]
MAKIVIENGPGRGRTFGLLSNAVMVVGRDPTAQICLEDEMASRRHFQIRPVEGRYQLEDLGSKNGLHLNGRRLEKKVVTLAPNDRIQVGGTLLTFVGKDAHPLIGREISGYRIEERIGRGGMGTVYRAIQLSLDRSVALKILAPHLVENQNFINLFIREARAAGALSHPNLVQVYDVGVEGDIYYYSMEYIPHGSVEELLTGHQPLPVGRALEIVRDAALGLQYAELKGLVHRDIKPGNLMIGADSIIKIGDLGIARFGEDEGVVSQKDGVSGSPHYIAPEQARGQDIDQRADLYALGVSFYQMLCGQTPYRGSSPREVILGHLKTAPPPLADRAPDLPAPVVELVEAMMEKDRDARIPSATAVLERLEPLLRRYRTGGVGSFSAERSGSRWKWAVGLLILGSVSIGATLAVRQELRGREEREARLLAWGDVLTRAETARSEEREGDLLTLLGGLPREELPPELRERADALERWYEEFTAAREQETRDRLRAKEYLLTEERIAALSEAEAVEEWGRFSATYPGTPEAARADAERARLRTRLEEQARRARSAELLVGPQIVRAEAFSRSGDFVRALDTLAGVDAVAIAGTPAEGTLTAAVQRIREECRAAFSRRAGEVRDALAARKFDEARLEWNRFRPPPFLSEKHAVLGEEITAAETAAAQDGAPVEEDALAAALREALPIWARIELGSPGESSQRQALGRLGIDLRSELGEADRDLLRVITRVMEELPAFIDAAGAVLLEEGSEITLRLADGTSRQVRISDFSSRQIITIARGEQHGTYVDWAEIAPAARLDVLRTSADLPHEQLPLYGWLALALGEEELAEQIWTAAEPGAPETVAALRAAARRLSSP